MNKTILTILVFCFVAFSAGAQVGNKHTTTDTKKTSVEQSKIQKEKLDKQRAAEASQVNPQVNNPNAPVIKFDKVEHDYGTLAYQADGNCEFKFTNEGKEPLILTNVKAS